MRKFLIASYVIVLTVMVGIPTQLTARDTDQPKVTTVTAETPVAEKEKPKKITDRRHPDYVRCRSESIIGSLSKKRRVCLKNKEWAAHNRKGNRRARELVEEMRAGATNGN